MQLERLDTVKDEVIAEVKEVRGVVDLIKEEVVYSNNRQSALMPLGGMPSGRDTEYGMLPGSMAGAYQVDEDGNPVLDENGNPVPLVRESEYDQPPVLSAKEELANEVTIL